MTMKLTKQEQIFTAARALRDSRATRRPIAQVSTTYGISTLADAYAVAAINTRECIRTGRRVIGKKIGLTSAAVQAQLGVDQPDFGVLFDDMELLNDSNVPPDRLIQPRIEAEIAFVVGRDLAGPAPSWGEFVACLAYCLPALEIVDSAITDWKITLVDTVADNASCGMYVLGDQPVVLGTLELAEVPMSLEMNGTTVSTGSGAACMGHPLRAAYWLARAMAEQGEGLHSGEIILSGALGPMVPLSPGDVVRAEIGGLGSVACRMPPGVRT